MTRLFKTFYIIILTRLKAILESYVLEIVFFLYSAGLHCPFGPGAAIFEILKNDIALGIPAFIFSAN